jgi:CHAT domain-containing protein
VSVATDRIRTIVRHLTGGIVSAEEVRVRPFAVPLLLAVACVMTSCAKPAPSQRTILDRQGAVRGLSKETLTIEVEKGDLLQISLAQTGLDLFLQLEFGGKTLGCFESMTGRYGEDRAQISSPGSGELTLTIGAVRFPDVTGTYHLIVRSGGALDQAEARFTSASRVDGPLPPAAERAKLFDEAAERYAGSGRVREEGLASFAALILLNDASSDATAAIKSGERAVAALRKSGDRLLLAGAINVLAWVKGDAKQMDSLESSFTEARELYEAGQSRIGVAEVRLYETALNYKGRDSEERLTAFRELERECSALHELVCQAIALTSGAVLLRNQGAYPATFDALYSALKLVDPEADAIMFADTSDNTAFASRMVGDFDSAIYHHERALEAYDRVGVHGGASRSLYGLGYSFLGVGDSEQALRFYKLALERSQPAVTTDGSERAGPALSARSLCELATHSQDLDKEGRAIATWTSWDLGNHARATADPASALACHEIATRLATSANYRRGTKLESVRDLLELHREQDANTLFSEVQPELAASHPWYRAQGAEVEGQLLAAGIHQVAAIERFSAAAKEYRDVGNFEGAFSALSRRAEVATRVRDRRANDFFADADSALEDVRLLSLDPSFSASLFASGRRIYEEWIESRLAAAKDVRSTTVALDTLAISERSRSRLLSQVAKATHVGQDAREARIRSVAAGALALLESEEAGRAPSAASTSHQGPAAQLNRELGLQPTRFTDGIFSAAVAELNEYRGRLDDQTTVVEYLLGEQQSYAWVVRKDSVARIVLANGAAIRSAVALARQSIESANSVDDVKAALKRLYDILWRPLLSSIHGGQVYLVLDDALHEVPFAALWDAERSQYLIEQATLTYLPSIQFAMAHSAGNPEATVRGTALLVGDPVYELQDARRRCSPDAKQVEQKVSTTELRRIPGSAREVAGIEMLLRTQGMDAEILVGCAATRARVLASHPQGYRFVHFATHATADRVLPQRSAIYLSQWNDQGGATVDVLAAADLLVRPLNADLVVLSGCSTAGGRQFSGEGSLGLPFSLLAGGSRQVISTLWPVADAASVTAMNYLYSGLVSRHESAATALRNAQLEMLNGSRWNHPRHWAAYSLLGI